MGKRRGGITKAVKVAGAKEGRNERYGLGGTQIWGEGREGGGRADDKTAGDLRQTAWGKKKYGWQGRRLGGGWKRP